MADLRDTGVAVFGVNVFVPGPPAADPRQVAAYVASLEAEASRLGVTPGEPVWDDDSYESKLEVLLARPPALVSFPFGIPEPDVVRSLQASGSLVVLSATTPRGGGGRPPGGSRRPVPAGLRGRGAPGQPGQ